MVDGKGFRLGEEQVFVFDIREKRETKKNIKKVAKGMKGNLRVAAIMALAGIRGNAGHKIKENGEDARKENGNSNGGWLLATFCTLAVIGAHFALSMVPPQQAHKGERTVQADLEDETMHDEPNEHDQQLWNLQDQLLRTETTVEEREAWKTYAAKKS